MASKILIGFLVLCLFIYSTECCRSRKGYLRRHWQRAASKKSTSYKSSSSRHDHPSNTGMSGSGSRYHNENKNNHQKNTYNTNSRYHDSSYEPNHTPTYTAPHYVYVEQYKDSGSRYGNLLTGLTLYNMGRSHGNYRRHHYNDDYYRHRHQSTSSSDYQGSRNEASDKTSDEATCSLRITENGKSEVLKIPCEIVSTFTEGSKKIDNESYANHTVCTTNITVTKISPVVHKQRINNNVQKQVTTKSPKSRRFDNIENFSFDDIENISFDEIDSLFDKFIIDSEEVSLEVTNRDVVLPTETTTSTAKPTLKPHLTNVFVPTVRVTTTNKTEGNVFTQIIKNETAKETIVNITVCTTIQNFIDPLEIKGDPISDTSNIECSVDITTKDSHVRNQVECDTLMQYSEMPIPEDDQKLLLPSREQLKSWIENPPWWMSLFIAI